MDRILNKFSKRQKSHHDSNSIIGKYVEIKKSSKEEFLKFLDEEPNNIQRTIYVHTPFCDKICSFCNMNRKQIDGSLEPYADYMVSEFNKYGQTNYFKKSKFDVIFFGGGTPTVYKKDQLKKILSAVQKNVNLADNYEFTFETTLHNLTDEKLQIMMKYGVNRLSVGIQTFSDTGRIFYNRTFTKNIAIEKLKNLQEKFNGDVCVDIIYNFPNETIEEVIEDARILKKLKISSVSFYSLMVHEGSRLSKDIKENTTTISDDVKKDYVLYRAFVDEMLNDENYYILELTKIARKAGDNYKYIKVRNTGGDTFPIGMGAGGAVGNIGIFNMNKDMSFFMKYNEFSNRFSRLSGVMQFPNILKSDIKKFLTEEEYSLFVEKMNIYKDNDFIREDEKSYQLTKDGIFWGNNISSEVIIYILEKTMKK
ncbi:MAG: radical SAM protein [Fusobacteriaceae bacterium]|jgi:oxygen-independent coproporphyrinogen-3 oxidase|nr:radical SAM protein [Fusobacteriaceae bacterium]